jgi:hypothetical protein
VPVHYPSIDCHSFGPFGYAGYVVALIALVGTLVLSYLSFRYFEAAFLLLKIDSQSSGPLTNLDPQSTPFNSCDGFTPEAFSSFAIGSWRNNDPEMLNSA